MTELHSAYLKAWKEYPAEKANHGIFCLLKMKNREPEDLTEAFIAETLEESARTAQKLLEMAFRSRKKDYDNPFRQATYRSIEEMNSVVGSIEDNSFLNDFRQETDAYCREVGELIKSLKSEA